MQIMEWAGVAFLAAAGWFVHPALALAVIGGYLFATAIITQLGERTSGKRGASGKGREGDEQKS